MQPVHFRAFPSAQYAACSTRQNLRHRAFNAESSSKMPWSRALLKSSAKTVKSGSLCPTNPWSSVRTCMTTGIGSTSRSASSCRTKLVDQARGVLPEVGRRSAFLGGNLLERLHAHFEEWWYHPDCSSPFLNSARYCLIDAIMSSSAGVD